MWTDYAIGPAHIDARWVPIETAYGSTLSADERVALEGILFRAQLRIREHTAPASASTPNTARAPPPSAEVKSRLKKISRGALSILEAVEYGRPQGIVGSSELLDRAPVLRHGASGDGGGPTTWFKIKEAILDGRSSVSDLDRECLARNLDDEHIDDLLLLLWSLARISRSVSAEPAAEGRRISLDPRTVAELIEFHRDRTGKTGFTYDDVEQKLSGPAPDLVRAVFKACPTAFIAVAVDALDRSIKNYKTVSPETTTKES